MLRHLVESVRLLDADALGIGVKATAQASHASSAPDTREVPDDHPLVQEIIRLSQIFGGVILTGPPGTSKTFFAAAAGQVIAGSDERIRFVQFHASYQYEDFMLGFAPRDEGGFVSKKGPFLELVLAAASDPLHTYVLVIDELSRADVGRVFGEALTYVDRTKRELSFNIANGDKIKVPSNFIILATMNPFDRGVDEVDAAFERRFGKVTMDPDRALLDEILTDNHMDDWLKGRVLGWFSRMNGHAVKNPAAAVGHAYFATASDEASLRDLWEYQLKYVVHRAFRRDEATRNDMLTAWHLIFQAPDPTSSVQTPSGPGDLSEGGGR